MATANSKSEIMENHNDRGIVTMVIASNNNDNDS